MRGKPREQGWLGGCREEHPRVCGENGSLFPWLPTPLENIPAYAGKTRPPISPWLAWSEHPRVCGENTKRVWSATGTSGTSSRMRGKRGRSGQWHLSWRNIPAYAGKTHRRAAGTPLPREHPRVCGENRPTSATTTIHGGTSPRMRRKPHATSAQATTTRNIPAYAGKT